MFVVFLHFYCCVYICLVSLHSFSVFAFVLCVCICVVCLHLCYVFAFVLCVCICVVYLHQSYIASSVISVSSHIAISSNQGEESTYAECD